LLPRSGIRLYVIIPLMVNSLLFAAVIFFGASQLSKSIEWLSSQWAWLEWFALLLWPLFVVISLAIVFFCFTMVANLASAPFNGFLAEAVETELTGKISSDSNSLSKLPGEMVIAIKSEMGKFLYFLLRAIPLLLLFFIPFIQTAAPVIWFLFCAWMLALEYLDFPMGNNNIHFPEVRQILGKRRRLVIGFGIGVMLFTMIPVINFVAMPAAVAGATRLWAEKLKVV